VLAPPATPSFDFYNERSLEQLNVLREALSAQKKHVVFLFDSLDRLSSLDAFATLVEQDVRALQSMGMGVVIVGPLRALFGHHRATLARFSTIQHQSSVDVQHTPDGKEFMMSVLRMRAQREILPDETCELMAEMSGLYLATSLKGLLSMIG